MFGSLDEITTISFIDFKPLLVTVVLYAIFRHTITKYCFEKISKMVKIEEKRQMRFANRCFDLVHYTFSAVIGVFAILSRPYNKCAYWAVDCAELFVQDPEGFSVTVFEKFYILHFLCYYIVDVYYLRTTNDFLTTAIHHVATLFLIFSSIYLQAPAVCVSIMVLHDIVDVPLYLGKIFTYIGYTRAKEVSLVTFAILCVYFRIINYPILCKEVMHNIYEPTILKIGLYKFTCIFLWVLYACHLVWFYDILKAVARLIRKDPNAICDNRSE